MNGIFRKCVASIRFLCIVSGCVDDFCSSAEGRRVISGFLLFL